MDTQIPLKMPVVVVALVIAAACTGDDDAQVTPASTDETVTSVADPDGDDEVGSDEPMIDFDVDVDVEANLEAFSVEEAGVTLQMRDVAGSSSGFVSVGQETEPDTTLPRAAAVWWSADGWNWERVNDDSLDRPARLSAVVATDDGFVAAGTVGRGGDDAGVWRSPDGLDWEQVEGNEATFSGGDVSDLVVGDHGLVAVGGVDVGDKDAGDYSVNAAIWRSDDGVEWERVPDSALPPAAADTSSQSFNAVTAAADGYIAGGVDDGEPMLWRSVDAEEWEDVDSEAFEGGVSIGGLASSDDGHVAIGSRGDLGDSTAAFWFSVDGDTWEHIDVDVDPELYLFSVAASDAGLFIAVGPEMDDVFAEEELNDVSQVWESEDGRSWELLPFEDQEEAQGSMLNVGVFANGYVAVGLQEDSAQVWLDEVEVV